MTFPLPATANARYEEDNVRFYAKSNRWQEERPYYERTTEFGSGGGSSSGLDVGIGDIDGPPPQVYIKSRWALIPTDAINLQFNFVKRDGQSFNWSDASQRADVWGQRIQGNDSQGAHDWFTNGGPTRFGVYANWGDDHWRIDGGTVFYFQLDVLAYTGQASNVTWNISYASAGKHVICRGGGQMLLHPKDINIIHLHGDEMMGVGNVKVRVL